MSRQACPSCGRRWEPPGPCTHLDGGETCGYREPERVHSEPSLWQNRTVSGTEVPAPARAPIPADNHSFGRTVDPKAALAECRAELEQAKQAKGAA